MYKILKENVKKIEEKNVMPRLHGMAVSLNKVTGYNLACIIPLSSFCILKLWIHGFTTPMSSEGISWKMNMTFTNVLPQKI